MSPYAWFTFSSRQHETRMRVWRVHLSCLSHFQPVFVSSRNSWKHVSKSVPSQRKRVCLECLSSLSKVPWFHSHSVLEPFTTYLYDGKIFFSFRLSCDFWELYVSRSSHTRVWMSTLVRTSSGSQFLVSLDEYPLMRM